MKRKTNKENGNKPLNNTDLRPTVRLLILLALLKLTLIAGLSYVVSLQGDQLEAQQRQLDVQGQGVARIDTYVQNLQSDDATRSQQIILYKIFLAQCEGRQITNPEGFASTGDKTVKDCADRLFLAQPQLPASDLILPTNTQ